jgi:hypothetical protein
LARMPRRAETHPDMKSVPENPNREYWLGAARSISRRVNFAWWLEALAAPALIASVLGATALLFVRREFTAISVWQIAAIAGSGAVIIGLGCRVWVARKFETSAQSLVRLEAAMQLKNSLSAAAAGVSAWPAPRVELNAGLSWQWPRLLAPPLAAAALLAAGWLIPISHRPANRALAHEQPQAWQQLSTELEKLTEDAVIDEKYLAETHQRLDELKSQDEQQWFSHASLEATDSLKKSHGAEAERIAAQLEQAGKALDSLKKFAATASDAEKNRLLENYDQALKNLKNGAMKPDPELLAQMQQLDLKQLSHLDPEQMQQLQENLQQHQRAMKKAKGKGQGDEESLAGEGEEKAEGEGEEGGQGAPDRGPGHVPNVLGKAKDAIETGELAGLANPDLAHAAPGDLLELQDGEHDVDRSPSKTSAGGETSATGKGGDRVWRDSLDPAEQRTLKRFFE